MIKKALEDARKKEVSTTVKRQIEFRDLKLTDYEQHYLSSVAIQRYIRDGHTAAEAWLGLLLEELQRAGYTITAPKAQND